MCNYFKIHPLVKNKKSFKGFSISSSGGCFFSTERNCLSNFGRRSPKEYSCIIISKSIHWLRQRSRVKVFLFLALVAISMEQNGLCSFGRGLLKENSCEIILNSVY